MRISYTYAWFSLCIMVSCRADSSMKGWICAFSSNCSVSLACISFLFDLYMPVCNQINIMSMHSSGEQTRSASIVSTSSMSGGCASSFSIEWISSLTLAICAFLVLSWVRRFASSSATCSPLDCYQNPFQRETISRKKSSHQIFIIV